MTTDIYIQRGLPDEMRVEAALLYDAAFGTKFAPAISDQQKRLHLLAESFLPEFAVVALSEGRLVGLTGFQTQKGAFTGGISYARLCKHLGVVLGAWALLVLLLYQRKAAKHQLLIDEISVAPSMRGKGIGTQMLEKLQRDALFEGYVSIQLDVIDTNPAARRLYERMGFVAKKTERFESLRWLLGFGASTTMEYEVASGVPSPSSGRLTLSLNSNRRNRGVNR